MEGILNHVQNDGEYNIEILNRVQDDESCSG